MEGHTEEAEADNNSKEDRIQQIEESNVNVGADKDLNRDKSVKIEESNVNETPKNAEHGLQKAITFERDLGQDKEEVQQIEESNVNVDDEADKDINQSKSVKIEESNVNEPPRDAEQGLLQKVIPVETAEAEQELNQGNAVEIEDGKRSEASKCSKLQSLIFGSLQKFFKAQVR